MVRTHQIIVKPAEMRFHLGNIEASSPGVVARATIEGSVVHFPYESPVLSKIAEAVIITVTVFVFRFSEIILMFTILLMIIPIKVRLKFPKAFWLCVANEAAFDVFRIDMFQFGVAVIQRKDILPCTIRMQTSKPVFQDFVFLLIKLPDLFAFDEFSQHRRISLRAFCFMIIVRKVGELDFAPVTFCIITSLTITCSPPGQEII